MIKKLFHVLVSLQTFSVKLERPISPRCKVSSYIDHEAGILTQKTTLIYLRKAVYIETIEKIAKSLFLFLGQDGGYGWTR
jgi:hypothetical protein